MGTLASLYTEKSAVIRREASKIWNDARTSNSGSRPLDEFETIIRVHRAGAAPEVIGRLPRLVFSVAESASPMGIRYVLWWPLVELLRPEIRRSDWIEEWVCSGEAAIVYVPTEVATLIEKLAPGLERARLNNIFLSKEASLRVSLLVFDLSAKKLALKGDPDAQRLAELWRQLHGKLANQNKTIQEELSVAAQQAPDWAVRACISLLRQSQGSPLADVDEHLRELTFASEASLAKDWLRPEEEEAWKNL